MDKEKHDWNQEQPHHVKTGKLTTEEFARKYPERVEWIKNKRPPARKASAS